MWTGRIPEPGGEFVFVFARALEENGAFEFSDDLDGAVRLAQLLCHPSSTTRDGCAIAAEALKLAARGVGGNGISDEFC